MHKLCWKGLLWGAAWPMVAGYPDKVKSLTWFAFGLGPWMLTFVPYFAHNPDFTALAHLDLFCVDVFMFANGSKYGKNGVSL